MLEVINQIASLVICLGAFWLVYTHRVPTGAGWSAVLGVVAVTSVANLGRSNCVDTSEVMLIASMAGAVLFAFWRIELRPRLMNLHKP